MRRNDKDIEWPTATSSEKEIVSTPCCRITGVIGSIFEETQVDVVVLFEYIGLADLSRKIRLFLDRYKIPHEQDSCVANRDPHEKIKAYYYVRTNTSGGKLKNVSEIICSTLDKIAAEGYSSIAMNGVKTQGYSELDNVQIINNWLTHHPESSIKYIRLVDKRGGFNKLSF